MTETRSTYDNPQNRDERSKGLLSKGSLDRLEHAARYKCSSVGWMLVPVADVLSLIREVREARRGGGGIAE